MNIYRVGTIESKKYLHGLGVKGAGVEIMSKKMQLYFFKINDMRTPALNILKQDALSIGAEVAAPSGAITHENSHYDALLIANQKQIEILAQKEMAQPFGLKDFALQLKSYLNEKSFPPKIMGIINANSDSFYMGSRFASKQAVHRAREMIEQGADIIDIGAVSTRPNAPLVSVEEEFKRIQPICDAIAKERLYEKASFSIDSTSTKVIRYALYSGFNIINDISGASNQEIIELAIGHRAKLCIMHMQGTPQTMQDNPQYLDVVAQISEFFERRIEICENLGLSRENIILDVGIGFGKTLEHNIELIRNMQEFKKFGCEILIGASRKSMIDNIIPTPTQARLARTLAIHLKELYNGANTLRCHDVAEHKQAIEIYKALHY
ncbi:MAG: dihydropteroate synthase [Campylobacterales bacterium]|nr:dihydropteroate synthase [Campylobacterales bacterium]